MEIAEIALQEPDELLYHYTSIDSFASIIGSSQLWASHIRFLNDTSEQRLMWDHARARIEARIRTADDSDRNRLLPFQSLTSSPLELDDYVLCFSKDGGDNLSQWRGYGGSAGVAIGIDAEELKKKCSGFTTAQSRNQPHKMGWALLHAVHYVDPSGDEFSKQLIDSLVDNPEATEREDWLTEREVFRRRVSLIASSLEHKAFSDEREWRISILQLREDFIRFRTRKSMMIPYVPFDLGHGRQEWPLIRRIVAGPSQHQAETIAAIKKMLDDRVVVEGSSIPYRDW
ncbi:MAG: DUF2971 domain-containing protein [Terracidiphilus sp.]|jgi:hypothetical protein